MKKLDSYMLRELIVPFLIGSIAVVMMFQANTYIYLGKNFNLENIPADAIYQLILYQTPSYLWMTLPVGTALGTSLAMTRIVRESELTAMRAAGTTIMRVILPLGLFGACVSVFDYWVMDYLNPAASGHAQRLSIQIGTLGYAPDVKTNTVIQLGRFTASFGSVIRKGEDMTINKVMLIEQPEQDVTVLTTADHATYKDGTWTLENAYYRRLDGEDLIQAKPIGKFEIFERIITEDLFQAPALKEQTSKEILASIDALRKMGQSTKQLEVNYHIKFSVPAACLLFAFIAPVFAIKFARGGAFVGVLLSMGLVILYYNGFVISTQILSKMDWISGPMAAWLPDIVFAVLGAIALRRLE
jgi:lipopolysaccharide export LptBFGC system permease protein LptF